MSEGLTIQREIHFTRGRRARKMLEVGPEPGSPVVPAGTVPRLARLMALAIRLENLVRSGEVADYADIARLGHVTRARVTQIMNLLNLAPDIQEELLFLPRTVKGRDTIRERMVRPITAVMDWRKQRKIWQSVKAVRPGSAG
jgi:hypothetical protein